MIPYSRTQQALPFTEGLELLGMKWLPSLTTSQAKEVTPYEVGDKSWKQSLHTFMNGKVFMFCLIPQHFARQQNFSLVQIESIRRLQIKWYLKSQ